MSSLKKTAEYYDKKHITKTKYISPNRLTFSEAVFCLKHHFVKVRDYLRRQNECEFFCFLKLTL